MICTTDTLSNEEIDIIHKWDNRYDYSGRDCYFIELPNKGIKIYRCQRMAKFTFLLQSFFHKRGLAPKCWGYFILREQKDYSCLPRYGYFTELANVHSCSYAEDVKRDKARKEIIENLEKLPFEKKRKRTAKTVRNLMLDLGGDNFGFLEDKPVMVDFSYYNK